MIEIFLPSLNLHLNETPDVRELALKLSTGMQPALRFLILRVLDFLTISYYAVRIFQKGNVYS